MADYPGDICGIKMIVEGCKSNSDNELIMKLNATNELMEMFPDFVVGFDMDCREDTSRPLFEFAGKLKLNLS